MNKYNLISKLQNNIETNDSSINCNVSKVLLDNLYDISKLTINNLAILSNSSTSAIVKFCKQMGLEGYKHLIQVLMFENSIINSHLAHKKEFKYEMCDRDFLNAYHNLIIDNLDYIKKNSENSLFQTKEKIVKARKIFLFGKGANLNVLSIFNNYLLKLGYWVFYSRDLDVQYSYLEQAGKNDLSFIFSYSGMTEEMINVNKKLVKNNCDVVLVTSNLLSPIINDDTIDIIVLNNEEVMDKQTNSTMSFVYIVMQLIYLIS
ncbi:MurR/RpiR family transcriptional regulator [Mesoplasma photuris]|uniref:MurR/RpiR family transcriptional regulator n=1 Tax=Mesoplasma photuris TaxID=217731 RepID=UPI0004E27D33|nr:MurR/RpiR family transcriptional regulator [Mesoplasma photuris]